LFRLLIQKGSDLRIEDVKANGGYPGKRRAVCGMKYSGCLSKRGAVLEYTFPCAACTKREGRAK